jgi:hypothetical protein
MELNVERAGAPETPAEVLLPFTEVPFGLV